MSSAQQLERGRDPWLHLLQLFGDFGPHLLLRLLAVLAGDELRLASAAEKLASEC